MKWYYLLVIIITFQFQSFSFGSTKIQILNKINNEIITNFDVEKEYNYLIALNNDLKNVPENEAFKIAKDSLIREKIKTSELKKFFVIDEFNNTKYLKNVLKSFYQKLNLSNEVEFSNYLNSYGLSVDDVKNKIKLEILWNQLIGNKYKNQINIDVDSLRKKIIKDKLNFANIVEYDLSEIVFQAKTQDELNIKTEQIKKSINNIGFNNTANKFSISESAKFGGKIGKIKENQLSNQIKKELESLNVNEITNPLNIGGSFLLLFINDRKEVELKQDEEEILKNMIEFERTKQFDQFSQVYFNKVKINVQIENF